MTSESSGVDVINTVPTSDFEQSARDTLSFLHRRLGFNLWMVTRTVGDDWVVLQTEDHGYDVEPGTVFRWADSFCSEMIKGNGPCIAPRSDLVPAYATAPIGQQVAIKAYVGVPLRNADGSLFGTLCAIHPLTQPESIVDEQQLVELLAAQLSTILQFELKSEAEARRAERLEAEALTDALTGLYNRGGWDRLLSSEEERCRRYGHASGVVIVDLDNLKQINDSKGHAAGDDLIVSAASALREAVRTIDVVARLGGDEFGVLCVECQPSGSEAILDRIRESLKAHDVHASIGFSARSSPDGLQDAWEKADQRMYQAKQKR